jgi:hypothetical protein
MIMTGPATEGLRNLRRSFLTEEQIFRLWSSAIKDDDRLVDEVIRSVYQRMIAYDRARSEAVMQLAIRRKAAARCALRALLEDMQKVCGPDGVKH